MMIRRVTYNLARRPRLDLWRTVLRLALLAAAIVLLSLLAVRQMDRSAATNARIPDLGRSDRALAQLKQEAAVLKRDIGKEKKLWEVHVRWANSLIQRKVFAYQDRFDFLERILPDGVQVLSLTLSPRSGRGLVLTAATPSFPQLLELYRRLSPYHLAVTSETHAENSYQVALQLEFQDATR
jgi:hypothetical protein